MKKLCSKQNRGAENRACEKGLRKFENSQVGENFATELYIYIYIYILETIRFF